MEKAYINNHSKLITELLRFASYIQYLDGKSGCISFRDSSGFLGREENYKSRIAEEARKELNANCWKESWIGTGKINDFAFKAMRKANNLVNVNQQIDFCNHLDPNHPKYSQDTERVLYDIYRNPLCSESDAFEKAIKTFGAKYDTIAFLFFIKNDSLFLPVSPGHFDKGFASLDIDYTTSHRCSWDNYQGFIDIIREIYNQMNEVLPLKETLRLIDAHSFIWIIQQDRYINWIPDTDQYIHIEHDAEEYIQNAVSGPGGRRNRTSNTFIRSSSVVKETRRRAGGICQYCRKKAPFIDKDGNPYLEVHHINWLSRGGKDSTDNTVALCPNCHTRMHILDNPADRKILTDTVNALINHDNAL